MTDNNPPTALITTNEGGFGLIEVLISLLLLSVVALGLITVQGRLLVQTKHADLRLQAVQLMANDYHAVRSFTPEQKADLYPNTSKDRTNSTKPLRIRHE